MYKFGDSLNETLGDSWRKRHNAVKQHITCEAALAGVPVDCEAYSIFSDLLHAAMEEEGGELQRGISRQGKVPDFKFL